MKGRPTVAWRPAAAAAAPAHSAAVASCCHCRCMHTDATPLHAPARHRPRHSSTPARKPIPAVALAVGLAAQKQTAHPIRIMAEESALKTTPAGNSATTGAGEGTAAAASSTATTTAAGGSRPEIASRWERETASLLASFTHPADRPILSSSFTAVHGLAADARSDPALRKRHTLKSYGRILSIRKQLDELIAARKAQQGQRERLVNERAAELRQERAHRRSIVRLGAQATEAEVQALYREEKAQEQRMPLGASAMDGAQEDERITRLLQEGEGQLEELFGQDGSAYSSAVPSQPVEAAGAVASRAAVQALQTSFESALVTLLHCLLWDLRWNRNSAHDAQESIHKLPWSSAADPLLRRFQQLQPLEALRRFSTESKSGDVAGRMTSWLWREYICTQISRSEEALNRQLDAYEQWAKGIAAARVQGKRGARPSLPSHFQKENPYFPLLGPREATILLRLLNCAPDLEASLQVHQYILRTQRVMTQALERAQRIDVEHGLSGARKLSEVAFQSLPGFVSCMVNQFESAMVDHYGVLIDACGKARPFADEARANALFVECSARMNEAFMFDLFDRNSLVYIQTCLLHVSAAAGDWRRAMYLLKHSIRQPTVIHVSLVLTAVARAFRRPPMHPRTKEDDDDDFVLLAQSPTDFAAKNNPRILPTDTRIEKPTAADYAARDADAMLGARTALRLVATIEARFSHQRDSQGVPYAAPRWERFFPDSHYYTLLLRLFGSVGDLSGCLYLMEQLLRGDAPGARNLHVGERFFSVLIHIIVAILRQTPLQRISAAVYTPLAASPATAGSAHTQHPAGSSPPLDPAATSSEVATLSAGPEDSAEDNDHDLSDDLAGFPNAPMVGVPATGSLYTRAQLFQMAVRVEQVMTAPPFSVQPTELTFQAMLCLHIAAPRIVAPGAGPSVPAVTQLWENLLATGVSPSRLSYERYLLALLAAREHTRALELLESMCHHRPSLAEPQTVRRFLAQTQRHFARVLRQQEAAFRAEPRITSQVGGGQTVSSHQRSLALADQVVQNQAWFKDVLRRLLPIYEHALSWPSAQKHSTELTRLLLACHAAARDHQGCLTLFQMLKPRVTTNRSSVQQSETSAPWVSERLRDLLSQVPQTTETCNVALWASAHAVEYARGMRVWELMHRDPSCADRMSYCLWIQLLVACMRPLADIQAAYAAMMRVPPSADSDARAASLSSLDPFERGVSRPRLEDFNQWIRLAWNPHSQHREALVLWLYRAAQKDAPHLAAQFPLSTLQIAWEAASASQQLGPSHAFTLELESRVRAMSSAVQMLDEARHEVRERRWEGLTNEFNGSRSGRNDHRYQRFLERTQGFGTRTQS